MQWNQKTRELKGWLIKSVQSGWRKVWTRRAGLTHEVSACLPVLETLESQIADAMKKANHATDDLSASFGDMAARARDVVRVATDARREENRSGVESVREVVLELLARVRKTTNSTEQTARMLQDIEQDLQNVDFCITQIEDIADQSRMVSLNGQIEAARSQVRGGFAVVASETGDLAKNVTETSQKIRRVVDRMADSLRRTTQHTQSLLEADKKAAEACEATVDLMLSNLAQYQNELETNLESTKSSSDELARAISQSVMTLQFQDAVSQRMNHVSGTLSEIRDVLGELIGPDGSDGAEKRTQEWLDKLKSSYCVEDELLVLDGQSAADRDQSTASNVELF